jgi:hypothetical protein
MKKPSYEEVIKLVEEARAAAIAYHKMNDEAKTRVLTPNERYELDKLAGRAQALNKKRIEVLSMFTEEEREEIKRLAQSKYNPA